MIPSAKELIPILRGNKIDLYLDYDGTLAPFAPTPDHIIPDDGVIGLISQIANSENIRVSIISGRRLAHIQKLIPVKHILLAGTYGVEMQLPNGQVTSQIPYDSIRPTLDSIKKKWQVLIEGKAGFYLEDKGRALAIHARLAESNEGKRVLEDAEKSLTQDVLGEHLQKIYSYRFLEVGPNDADKGHALKHIFSSYKYEGSIPIYIGDDDKDEDAFRVINQQRGYSILVSETPRKTAALYILPSPNAVQKWLRSAFL